jgi:uncharacterized protein (TIGR02268 family)
MLMRAPGVSAGGGEEAEAEAAPVARKPRVRMVRVSGEAEEVRVAARTATRLRFDTVLDAGRTRLEEGRERFERLLVGRGFVLVTPREELAAGERVLLTVVLADGTRLPFALATSATEVDVQVQVSREPIAGDSGGRRERPQVP